LPPADRTARHLVLLGPTASGKSSLALELARQADGAVELVCVDSMQVYRGMDIGTAKPTPTERAQVPHHLLDLAEPSERFTVARFRDAASDVLAGVEARGHTAILVAGTGLYLQAAIGDLDPPGEWPDVRAALDREPDTHALHEQLTRLDPRAAARMEPSNRRRVLRALEVTEGSGRPFSSYGPGVDAYPDLSRFRLVGVWLPREVVAHRIDARLNAMLDAGLVAEVRRLGPCLGPTARQALGYKEVLAHVEDGLPLNEAVQRTIRRTRAFAVRQRRWFRRDPRVRWLEAETNPVALLPALLRELGQCRQ
jgi:tRNA dimethylallyltransferase